MSDIVSDDIGLFEEYGVRHPVFEKLIETYGVEDRWISCKVDKETLEIVLKREYDGKSVKTSDRVTLIACGTSHRAWKAKSVIDARIRIDNIANTLSASYGCNNRSGFNFVVDLVTLRERGKCRLRHLTPTECERVMGWPEGWTSRKVIGTGNESVRQTERNPDALRYKMCGNGVVSPCALAAFKSYLENVHDPFKTGLS